MNIRTGHSIVKTKAPLNRLTSDLSTKTLRRFQPQFFNLHSALAQRPSNSASQLSRIPERHTAVCRQFARNRNQEHIVPLSQKYLLSPHHPVNRVKDRNTIAFTNHLPLPQTAHQANAAAHIATPTLHVQALLANSI
jgi:hypothetical protein